MSSVSWRPDDFLGYGGPQRIRIGQLLFQIRFGLIQFGLGYGVFGAQTFEARQIRLRPFGLRVQGAQLRLFRGGIQTQQHIALGHHRARFKSDLADGAGHFGGDLHALHGGDRTDGRQGFLPLLFAGHGGGNRFGWGRI